MTKILHITNWYPNKWNDVEALFIQEQFKLFSDGFYSNLIHVEVRLDKKWFKYEKINYSKAETGFYIFTRIKSYRIIEILSSILLIWALLKSKYYNYNILHFHIAYPLLTYFHLWKKLIKKPVVISEHWSAYHFNFYMPLKTNKLDRIKAIFRQHIPLITVSKALLNDIQKFAGTENFPSIIIPNVIDHNFYHYKDERVFNEIPVFFIVNFWRKIKQPFPMLEAFAQLAEDGVCFELRIGGYGDFLDEMKSFVKMKDLQSHIVFLGKMQKKDIAEELSKSSAYLFSSEYETFSAACAQALSCGCPLIGPAIPAILEYAGPKEMIAIDKNTSDEWKNAILDFMNRKDSYDRKKISEKTLDFLSHTLIKAQYKNFCGALLN